MAKQSNEEIIESGVVHFTIGSDLGVILMNIAQEHLLYSLDPEKAVRTIAESLIGCPEDLALQILKGDMVLPVDEDTQEVICVPREANIHTMFPVLEIEKWSDRQVAEIEKQGNDLRDSLADLKNRAAYKTIYKSYDFSTIMQFVAGNDDIILDELRDMEEVSIIEMLFKATQLYIGKSMKTIKVLHWLRKTYPQEFLHAESDDYRLTLGMVMGEFKKLAAGNVVKMVEDQSVSNYIEAVKENNAIVEAGIEPVDIMDNYSAGWLDREGKYYALNGEIANMLHQEIEDALQKKGIIPMKDNKGFDLNGAAWLEQQGWVKIHTDNINYGGCINHKLSGKIKNIDMNDKQKQIIYNYIQRCHNGIMRLGWRMTKVSAARFEMMPVDMLNKDYFSFD